MWNVSMCILYTVEQKKLVGRNLKHEEREKLPAVIEYYKKLCIIIMVSDTPHTVQGCGIYTYSVYQ